MEMSEADVTKDIQTVLSNGYKERGDFRWTISRVRFGERQYESENAYVMVASFILTLNYLEVATIEQ